MANTWGWGRASERDARAKMNGWMTRNQGGRRKVEGGNKVQRETGTLVPVWTATGESRYDQE
jgi:hypothetical protein